MSKINIQATINNITTKTNIYTPVIEAIVNSIEAIDAADNENGKIVILFKRENTLEADVTKPSIINVEIQDNGIGFNQRNRDSFDTFYSAEKNQLGGKGFGRFMFLKYFNDVKVNSIYKSNGTFYRRQFTFGKKYDIIINEENEIVAADEVKTIVYLNTVIDKNQFDKGIDVIARKLLERLLIFFVDDNYKCPQIILREEDGSKEILLNDYLNQKNEIQLFDTKELVIQSSNFDFKGSFILKTFKIYYSRNLNSRISLTAHNREVTETALHTYIPEFEDDFFDEFDRGDKGTIRKNYIIKTYVLADYLNKHVALERETFNFPKDKHDIFYQLSQSDIEKKVAEYIKSIFYDDVNKRMERKKKRIADYVTQNAPWHRPYLNDIDLSNIPYKTDDEKIEIELQKVKFHKELNTRVEINKILNSDNSEFDEKYERVISQITNIGKSDLAHYVCNRKVVLEIFKELLKRRENGKGNLEKEVHNLIFPMGKDNVQFYYEDHNLWLIDERLVFAEYIASDRKIGRKNAAKEPDLVIFDQKKSFRNGDNEYSNPLTIFEFKRPKREAYKQDEDPVLQIGNYLKDIRAGKYETPDTIEKIKVNDNTPVYSFVICDITPKIKEFAELHQLTISPDSEGYFGYHRGFKMYIEIISFSKLLKDANLRNKIFFNKLQIGLI